jgi:hypothetical protein
MMFWLGFLLATLATIVVGWVLPLMGVALVLPLIQLIYTLQPLLAAGVMIILGGLLVWQSLHRQAYWQAVVWGALWGLGALTAGLRVFHWYALILESVLVILLLVPGIVVPTWAGVLRWFATGELALTLFLIWGERQGMPGVTVVMALLLLALAALVGSGSYRPFEARRLRRRLAGLATLATVTLLLWQPVVLPVSGWLGQAAGQLGQAVSISPPARWYRISVLRWERREIGETAKTASLRQIQPALTASHRQRWEKAIKEIPALPLAPGEWRDLGIPREADP